MSEHDPLAVEWTDVEAQRDYLTEFAAAVREDERRITMLGHGFDIVNSINEGYEQGQRDERERWTRIVTDRLADLRSCRKPDDCRIRALGVQVVLDDAEYDASGAKPWEPGDPCPGCKQRPCVCVTISLSKEKADD